MPRNGSGGYSLPEAPFVPNTTILSAEVNSDFDDIADALTGSVAADGQTVMTGALAAFVGSLSLPGWSWAVDPNSGRYRSGDGLMSDVCNGTSVADYSTAGVDFPVDLTVRGGGIVMPAGVMLPYGGASAPTGWLLCFGQSLLRTDFPDLFTAIGTAYGSADGTHFNVPDLRGRVPAGKDDMGGSAASRLTSTTMTPDGVTLAAVGGAQTVTLSQGNLPSATLNPNTANQTLGHTSDGGSAITPNGGSVGGTFDTPGAATGFTSDKFAAIDDHTVTFPTVALGGSDTPTNKVQPTIITNYIIKT